MKILQVPVKYHIGEILYTIEKVKEDIPCAICEGVGTIKYNNKDMRCPECMGAKYRKADKATNKVVEEPAVVSAIRTTFTIEGNTEIKYKVKCGNRVLNRSDVTLFETIEEAQSRCDELNSEQRVINLSEVVILDSYKECTPSIDKIQAKLQHYKAIGDFDKTITINRRNELVDGYITYLLCNMLNVDSIMAKVE